MKLLSTAALIVLVSALLPSCCGDAKVRYWKLRDAKTGAVVYAVDTEVVPLAKLAPSGVVYLDKRGKAAHPASPKTVGAISEAEWRKATAGADYSLYYCGHCKGCWAKVKPVR